MFATIVSSCEGCPLGATGRHCPLRPVSFPARTRLCAQGEVPPRVIFVREGLIALTAVTPDGGEAELTLRGPRSVVCLETLHGAASAHEVRALTAVTVCVAGRPELERWLGPEESPARRFVSLLLSELEHRQEDAALRRGGALGRVARLLSMCSNDHELEAIPKNVLARSLGLRAETFARCLTRLQARGLIVATPKLRVIDPAALRSVA